MALIKKVILACSFISLFACRARPDASETAAVETTSFKGRVAIFDVYDKDKRLLRQAPGVLVSARAVLMPGISPDESVVLADAQRRGERYIPLPTEKASVAFIGLEADDKNLGLAPTPVDAVPPLSSQVLAPIELNPIRLSEVTKVVMYNEYGYVVANASLKNGMLLLADMKSPMAYRKFSIESFIFEQLLGAAHHSGLEQLNKDDRLKMLKKGGAIISVAAPNNGVSLEKNGRKEWYLKSQNRPSTVDILAYVGEDSEYAGIGIFRRRDILQPVIEAAITGAGAKLNVPRDVEGEILKYLECDKP